MKNGLALEQKISTFLEWTDPNGVVARMATKDEDRFKATDMWVRDHPVQLTTIQDKTVLLSKAKIAFQSMPNTGKSRWVVSAPAHISNNQIVKVIKTIANDNTNRDRVITLH